MKPAGQGSLANPLKGADPAFASPEGCHSHICARMQTIGLTQWDGSAAALGLKHSPSADGSESGSIAEYYPRG